MADKRSWSEEQDKVLKHVFETSGLTKWSHIARKMEVEHGITGRSGKQCRERYLTHIDCLNRKQEWNSILEQRLVELHNQIGNKWAVIGQRMGGISDNSIKNHFYSLLRRALRKLNTIMVREHYKDIKDFKPPILYRIVEVADQASKGLPGTQHQFAEFSHQLKNQLLDFSFDDEESNSPESDIDLETAKNLISKVAEFISNYKKRGRRSRKGSGNNLLSTRKNSLKRSTCEQGSEGSQDQLDDIFTDAYPFFKMSKSRRLSYASMTSQIIMEEEASPGIRTRARSQGNVELHFQEKPNYEMTEVKMEGEQMLTIQSENRNGNISDHLEIDGIMSGIELMEEPSLYDSMKKKKSYSIFMEGEHDRKMDCQFHFFDESPMNHRPIPSVDTGLKQEELDEQIYQYIS